MATAISRDILNDETNARFWIASGYKVGQRLDPNNPLDRAQMPVWRDIFQKVTAEANAGTLVTTYDRPEVVQALADAEIANTVAEVHVDAGTNASDPTTAQQHAAAAATAVQVATQRLNEAAANQPPTVSPGILEQAVRDIARIPPSPSASAADHIAQAQAQNGQNGQNGQMLRPEEDPWDPRYVPMSQSEPPVQPSRSPREQPSREVLYRETNNRFWQRHGYKPGQRLDMSNPQDLEMSKIWNEIFREVQSEANAGRLTFTPPPANGAPPSPSQPMPPPAPSRPLPPRPLPPLPQQPMPPPFQQPGMPMPPPIFQQPGMPMPPWQQPGRQGMPPGQPGRPPGMQPGMPMPPWQRPGMQPGMPTQQPMRPPLQQRMPMQPVRPLQPGEQQPTGAPSIPLESSQPFPSSTERTPPLSSTGEPTLPTDGAPGEGMSTTAKVALGLVGLGALGAIVYAVTRKPAGKSTRFRARTAAPFGASSVAFPPARGGKF